MIRNNSNLEKLSKLSKVILIFKYCSYATPWEETTCSLNNFSHKSKTSLM